MEIKKDYAVKIDPETAGRVKQLAKRDRRTVKAEFLLLLELGMKCYEQEEARR